MDSRINNSQAFLTEQLFCIGGISFISLINDHWQGSKYKKDNFESQLKGWLNNFLNGLIVKFVRVCLLYCFAIWINEDRLYDFTLKLSNLKHNCYILRLASIKCCSWNDFAHLKKSTIRFDYSKTMIRGIMVKSQKATVWGESASAGKEEIWELGYLNWHL